MLAQTPSCTALMRHARADSTRTESGRASRPLAKGEFEQKCVCRRLVSDQLGQQGKAVSYSSSSQGAQRQSAAGAGDPRVGRGHCYQSWLRTGRRSASSNRGNNR